VTAINEIIGVTAVFSGLVLIVLAIAVAARMGLGIVHLICILAGLVVILAGMMIYEMTGELPEIYFPLMEGGQ